MNPEAIRDKADSLASRINRLNGVFGQADIVTGDDVIDSVQRSVEDIKSPIVQRGENPEEIPEVISLQNMVDDFQEIRDTLRETVDTGRKIVNQVAMDIIDVDDDKKTALIASFAQLVTAVNSSMKLLAASYKDISTVLLNIDKLNREKERDRISRGESSDITIGEVHIHNTSVSTTELIQQLKAKRIEGDL